MKKIPIIVMCVSVAALIVCIALGVSYRALPEDADTSQNTSDTASTPSYTVPDISVDVVTRPPAPTYNLPLGTYYLVASTNASPYLHKSNLGYVCQYESVILTFREHGVLAIQYYDDTSRGNLLATWAEDGDNISVDAPSFLQNYKFDVEHSDEWLRKYKPDNLKELTCTYDKDKNLLTLRHGVDSMEFMHFDTLDDVIAWYSRLMPESGFNMPDFFWQYQDMSLLVPPLDKQ